MIYNRTKLILANAYFFVLRFRFIPNFMLLKRFFAPPYNKLLIGSTFLLCAVIFIASIERQEEATSHKPNIILIVADDLGTYDLGCYGNPVIETPRLDSMAAQGIQFWRAYAASPICSPSRAAIQTGLHPARIALTEHIRGPVPVDPCWPLIPPKSQGRLALAYQTLGEAMKELDYQTMHIGKWHLGGGAYKPDNHGYDISLAGGGQGLPNSYFPPYFNGNNYPELTTLAADDTFLTDALTTLAIKSLPTDTSHFFMQLSYYSPHVPIMAPQDLVTKYQNKLLNDPDTLPRPHYAAMVEAIDRQVGRLIDTLRQRNMLENTIILFTSDHGALTVEEVPAFAQHTPPTTNGPLREGKGSIFEGGLRVPLIAYGPGLINALQDSIPTTNTDFMSTLTHLGGQMVTTPDGEPIPSLTGKPASGRSLYWHYPHYSPQGGWPAGAMLEGDEKMIDWYADVDSVYLFDLQTDPGEQLNRYPQDSLRAKELKAKLAAWREAVGALEMTPNPAFDPVNCN